MTIRKEIIKLLSTGAWTAGEISRELHVPQKEVHLHMEHIMRSLRGDFRIIPAECLSCGFTFSKRRSIQSPSRCPLCKGEHIKDPAFSCDKKECGGNKKFHRRTPDHQPGE